MVSLCCSVRQCDEGSENATLCPAGTYNPLTRGASVEACLTCPKGARCSAGAIAPTVCKVGTYQDETAQAHCKQCPPSAICLAEGLAEATASPCARGYYFNETSEVGVRCTVELCCHICPIGSACDGKDQTSAPDLHSRTAER